MTNDLAKTDWWNSLVEDCKSIMVEKSFSARMEIIEAKWSVGERVATDTHYEKFAKGTGKFIEELSTDLEIAPSDLYDCVRFYKKFPAGVAGALERLGKDVSWRQIRETQLSDSPNLQPKATDPRYKLSEIERAFKNYLVGAKGHLRRTDDEWEIFKNLL